MQPLPIWVSRMMVFGPMVQSSPIDGVALQIGVGPEDGILPDADARLDVGALRVDHGHACQHPLPG